MIFDSKHLCCQVRSSPSKHKGKKRRDERTRQGGDLNPGSRMNLIVGDDDQTGIGLYNTQFESNALTTRPPCLFVHLTCDFSSRDPGQIPPP